MVYSGMLRCVALVRTDALEELSASLTQRNIPEDAILQFFSLVPKDSAQPV
jgi:hypothetical protein